MFAPARFPALALPEDVGGMLLDDGGVEVACTPLHAVASVARHDVVGAAPRELCVFGVVDAVKIFDGGGDDESRARLVVDLRSGPAPTDRCEAWFFGGAALGCRGLAAPGVALVAAKARLGWADESSQGVVKCWARAVVAAVDDATLAAAEAAGLGRKRPDWTAEQCVRAAASKLRALRAQRERSGAWAAASDVGDDVRAKRCWLCGDAWAPTRGGGDALCASFPLCGGRRPHGARNPRAGARAFGVELVPGLERFRLRCLPRPRGEPRDAIETLRGQARELGRATAMDCGGDWPTFPVQRLVEVERFLDAAWRRGEVRGVRKAPPAAVAAVRSKPLPITDADVAELLRDVPPALLETLAPFQRYGAAFALRRRRVLLADEMGAGKTMQALAALAVVLHRGASALIVCPAGCRAMWAHEVERWLPRLTPRDVTVVRSSLDAPAPPPAPPPRVVVISFQMLERLRELDVDGPFTFDAVVVDEAHAMGVAVGRPEVEAEAPRTKRILALVKRARALALLLSGTPTFSKPLSLFPLVDALARGGEDDGLNWLPARRVAERRLQFCRHFCGARRYYGGRRGAAAYDATAFTAELHAILGGLWMLRRLKRDVLTQLPPLRRVVHRLDDAATEARVDEAQATTAFHAAGRAKVRSAAAYVVRRLARDDASKLVVFGHHVDVLDELFQAIEAARDAPGADEAEGRWRGGDAGRVDGAASGEDRARSIRRFRGDAAARVLVVSVTAGGVGVDLSAASEAVFVEAVGLEATWLRQAEDRLHRRGQTRRVVCTYLLAAPGSWEDARWPRVHASLRATSSLVNGEARAERFAVCRRSVASRESVASAPVAPSPLRTPPPTTPTTLDAWRWTLDDDSDDDDDDDDDEEDMIFFEVSPHSGRVHVHAAADGARPLAANCALDDLEVPRAVARRSGVAAAAAAALRALPRCLNQDGARCRAAWRFARDWARLTTQQRGCLLGVCARSPLADACAAVHVARARAATARAAPSTRRHVPWQEVVALASSQHRCQTILVRVENRERLGLAPIRQAYDPQTHQAKCLACPTFYACAPRRRSLFAGSLQELFCGRACREAYACQTSAQGLRRVVFARDGGVCALCGADGHALVERLRALAAAPHGRRVAAALRANAAWADFPRCLDRLLEKPSDGRAWEADHAVRVADGGGEALADRVQTLCVPCHKVKTKQEAKRAAAERRAAKKKPRVAAGDDDDDGDCRLECVPVKTAKEFLAAVAEDDDDDDSWL